MQFPTALEGFWLARRRDMSRHTVADYSVTFRRFADFIGPRAIGEITPTDIHRFLNHVKTRYKLSDKTLSNAWIALSSFWTWAELELGVNHPMRGVVRRPQFCRAPIEAYSESEIKAMVAACDQTVTWNTRNGLRAQSKRPTAQRDKTILVLLIDTGIRASELCDLTLRDYEQEAGRLLIRHGKGNKRRTVYVGEAAQRYLWRYLSSRSSAKLDDPLFVTRAGQPLDRTELLKLVERIATRAGVSRANVHRCRHTYAVNFLRNGGNVLELQKLLGHEKIDTLRIYVELAQMDLAHAQHRASPADKWGL